jgi:hypothetical protein
VELRDDLERIAAAASARGPVTAVIAAEPAGRTRLYLVAFGEDEGRKWLVLDDEGEPIDERALVREVASIVVLTELAEELSGGGRLEELRAQLAQLRITEQTPGVEAAEEAALGLERAIGAPPRVASPAFLDAVGEATRTLERALGEADSPFASALRSSTGAVDGFLLEVEKRYAVPLR